MSLNKQDLLHLLHRPYEPIYYPKGFGDDTVLYNVTPDYLTDEYRTNATEILNRFSNERGRRIDIGRLLTNDIKSKIKLNELKHVRRRENFSLFIDKHAKCAAALIKLFMEAKDINELMAIAAYCRDRLNPQVFVYSLSTALLHRQDTKDLRIPTFMEVFPSEFLDMQGVQRAAVRANILSNPSARVPIEILPDYTGTDADPEHRLAYFREDIGINLHHWHWHLVYPFDGPMNLVNKDRRGELFFYMHHQIMARYNCERLCNSMNLTAKWSSWDMPIQPVYFPKLNDSVAGRSYPSRPHGIVARDVNRTDQNVQFDLSDLKRFTDRIFESIHRRSAVNSRNQLVNLENDQGIDILGNIVESSILSINRVYYGNLHNSGHLAFGYAHDPLNKYLESSGVIALSETAMRDPIFYRWHAFINDMFLEHKNTLPPYTVQQLTFNGIQVEDIEVRSASIGQSQAPPNTLHTFWTKTDVDLSRGMDFAPRGNVLARVTHLNHDPFTYFIRVNNTSGRVVDGTVRIFIAPVLNFGDYAFTLPEQKNLFMEMDRFVAKLEPGQSTVVRRSMESAITIPFEQTFRNLNARPDPSNTEAVERYNYCGCGWPQHMLLPRGSRGGYTVVLFAMITDYAQDRAQPEQDLTGQCRTGVTFCGLKDLKYPDRKPMGFPFDRPMRSGVNMLPEFLTPNMRIQRVTIVHLDETRAGNLLPVDSIPAAGQNTDRLSARPNANAENGSADDTGSAGQGGRNTQQG